MKVDLNLQAQVVKVKFFSGFVQDGSIMVKSLYSNALELYQWPKILVCKLIIFFAATFG